MLTAINISLTIFQLTFFLHKNTSFPSFFQLHDSRVISLLTDRLNMFHYGRLIFNYTLGYQKLKRLDLTNEIRATTLMVCYNSLSSNLFRAENE